MSWTVAAVQDARGEPGTGEGVAMELARYPALPLMCRAFELRDDVIAYDAVYIALAERLDWALVTADQRLAAAPGIACSVEVLRGWAAREVEARTCVRPARRRYGIDRLEVFGSVARGEAEDGSDVDLLYELAPEATLGWEIGRRCVGREILAR